VLRWRRIEELDEIPVKQSLLCTALFCAFCLTVHAHTPAPAPKQATVPNFVPVTDAIMRAPKPEDWLMYRGNYQGLGYGALDQVDKTKVKNLQLAWSRVMWPGINPSTPIILSPLSTAKALSR